MKHAFTALFLCLAILLGIAQSASGAYVDPTVKNRVGGFRENPNIHTYEIDPFAPETHREITIPHYDIATGVGDYVNQNPWSSFDSLGLKGGYISRFVKSFVKRPLVHATSIVRGVLPPNIHPKDYYSVKGFTENAKWAWSKNPMTLALNPVSQQVGDTADVVSGKATHAEIKAKRVDPVIASVKRKLTTAEGHGEMAADVVMALSVKAGAGKIRNKISSVTEKNKAAANEATQAPVEAYNRRKHYGSTPTKEDREAVGVSAGEVADHDPPLVKRYYEGDPARAEKPGFQMTDAERRASAKDRSRMKPQPRKESDKQGAEMSRYSREKKKEHGL